jgi:formyltetrahydrofolate-dependent phosphoribosylglycinamide formyltransferase
MKRIVVLISGGGSNLQALIDAAAAGTIAGKIVFVVSNRTGVYGLERARRAGIETEAIALKPWLDAGGTRESYDAHVARRVAAAQPDLVVLAGWMHVFGVGFLDAIGVSVINLHPALPGQFGGTRAIERALEAFRRGEIAATGVMVHRVVAEVDAGPVLGTAPVAIDPSDDIASLSARMHAAEHRLLVDVVRDCLAKDY